MHKWVCVYVTCTGYKNKNRRIPEVINLFVIFITNHTFPCNVI